MKLSSVDVIAEYRATLKQLRAALRACGDGSNKLTVKTWHMGNEYDFIHLLTRSRIKSSLADLLTHEIGEVVRSLEAHGVVVDE